MSIFRNILNFLFLSNLRLSIVQKLIIILAFIFIVFFVVVGFFAEKILREQIILNTQESSTLLIQDEVENMQRFFSEYEEIGNNSAKIIKQWIIDYRKGEKKSYVNKLKLINKAYRTDTTQYLHSDISAVYVPSKSKLNSNVKELISATENKFDNYAKGVSSSVFNTYFISKEYMVRIYEKDLAYDLEYDHELNKDIFFIVALPENNPEGKQVWTPPYYDAILERWMTSNINPIYIDGEFIGLVGHDVFLHHIYKKVIDKEYYTSGFSFIFDDDQNIIVHPEYLDKLELTADYGELLKTTGINDTLLAEYISSITSQSEPNIELIWVGDEDLYISSKLNILNWYFAIKIPAKEILSPLNEFRKNFFYVAIIATILLFGIIIFIIWFSVVSPIDKLTITANLIQNGDLNKKVKIESKDEIGTLADSFNNMTSQLKRQLKLSKSAEEKYKSIFDHAVEGIIKATRDGEILECNPAAAFILGYKDEDEFRSIVKNIADQVYVNKSDRRILLEKFEENDIVANFEIPFYKKDRTKIWVTANLKCLRNKLGEIEFIEGLITDITEQKKANEELRYTNTLLKTEFDNSVDGILVVNQEGKMISFNRKFVNMWKIPDSVVQSKSDAEAIESVLEKIVDKEGFVVRIKHLYNNRDEKSSDEILLKDGRIFLRLSSPLISGDNIYYGRIWYFRDVTEQRKNQKELLEAKEKAELSEKLKSEFLAQVSHEIRTPINSILSFSSLMRSELEEKVDEELKIGFESMNRAGQRIIRTIDLILNMSEVQSGTYDYHPKPINVYEEIVLARYNEFKYLAKQKNLELKLHRKTDDLILNIDEYTVSQIVQNLIDNAIKYTNEGSVEIILERDKNNNLEFRVKDTGIGISEEYIPNLFQAFTQEEQGYTRLFEGNGLGLALVKNYCTLNNAEIYVESEKGKGTEFKVVFMNKN